MTVRSARLLLPLGLVSAAARANVAAPPPPPLPPVDLGQTNILDAEGKPGGLLEIISFGAVADRLVDGRGDDAPGRNDQTIASLIVHPILVSGSSILGAHPGLELLVPLSRVDDDFTMGAGRLTGPGDVTISPFLQWSARPQAGAVSARLAFQVVAPTGDYSRARTVNTGQGGWQVSPYLAMSWRLTQRWEVSGRAIYDTSGCSPALSPAGDPIHTRPGDLFALNLSASYAVADVLRIGPGGYFLQQLTDSRQAGAPVTSGRSRVVALGPVTRLRAGQATLLLAAFGEFAARQRPEGLTVNLRFQYPF